MLAEEEADGICAAQEEASAQTVVVAGRRWRRSIRVGKEKERDDNGWERGRGAKERKKLRIATTDGGKHILQMQLRQLLETLYLLIFFLIL
jgi:hypothetical protein